MEIKEIMSKYNIVTNEIENHISVIYETDNFKIGKQKDAICFIIDSNIDRAQRYRNGEMKITLDALYIVNGIKGLYSVLSYHTNNTKQVKIFIDTLISCVGDSKISSIDLYELYNEISNIFKPMRFDNKNLIGLIGELYFIYLINEFYEINMASFYQGDKEHLVDFKYQEIIFEVKTTMSRVRKHFINNDQIKGRGFLISVLIEESNTGITFENLYANIKKLLTSNPKKMSYIENFINTIPKHMRNDKYELKPEVLRCYDFNDVPKIINYHESISGIKFICDFSNLEFINIKNLSL